jgi:transcription-repair coupling factor (superfamily II helicase)
MIEGLSKAQQRGFLIVAATRQAQRLGELLAEAELHRIHLKYDKLPGPGNIVITSIHLGRGFRLRGANLEVFTDGELFGWKRPPRPGSRRKETVTITALSQLKAGDYVVHIHHGIGVYGGLIRQVVDGAEREYLLIRYAGEDKLYVPADQFDRVQKYIGGEAQPPALSRLGGREWERTKRKAQRSARELAKELVALYAARSQQEGFAFSPDTPWQQEMEAGFPYEETDDQRQALTEVKQDMEKPAPMERLVCGDVGFGKTEVAVRAAFKAVMDGKQVAVLVPTTVLAAQHFNTFRERLAPYPMRVEMLSRFRSPKERKRIVAELAAGAVDVVIGTHRLLSRDVKFKELGLLIVDEEQRFGVRHKEKLKQLRATVDCITLTATPIPRTLHMALSGLREMSLINDPPEGRRPIRTQAGQHSEALIKEAVEKELDRGGQVYYVYNRVESIPHVAAHLQRLLPQARIAVGHGQMAENDLEKIMVDFYAGKHDILLCTTIIESGLDIPNVNTIIVDQSDRLGLAQLYQLRGRVGRSDRQAYAYLMWTPHKRMTEAAEQRIQAIKEFCDLGSGLKLALRDLEIRGAGNLLGPEQHGFVAAVGFDLYCQMLSEAVSEARGQMISRRTEVSLDLPVNAFVPDEWVPSLNQRIELYRRLAAVSNEEMLQDLAAEMKDRFGAPLPGPVKNLVHLVGIKLICMANRVGRVAAKRGLLIFELAGPPLSKSLMRELRAALAVNGPVTREAKVEPLQVTLPFKRTTADDLFLLVEQTLRVIGLLPKEEDAESAYRSDRAK